MAINFPNSPTDGQIYSDTQTGNRWVWDNANTCWKSTSTYAQTVTVSATQPGTPTVGQLWWSQDYGRLFVYYNDGNSTQWVEANPADQTAGLVFNTANAAYGRANTALQNTSGTFAGSIAITGNTAIGATPYVPPDASLVIGSNTKFEISNPGKRRIYSLGPTSSNYLLNSSGGAAILFDRISGSDELAFETHYTGNSHAERMRITKEGFVLQPYQPMVHASRTGGGWTNYGTGSNYVFNSVYVNNGSYYNSSTGIFTCPVAGYYKVTVDSLMGQGGGATYFYFRKNGTNYGTALHCNTNSTNLWPMSNKTWLVSCAVSDTLNIFATATAASIYDGDHNSITIELVA